MKQEIFETRFAPRWLALERWLDLAPRPAGPNNQPFKAHEFPARYRELAQHFALARDRHYSGELVARLERIVLAGHQALYAGRDRPQSGFVHFVAYGLPQAVRARYISIWTAATLFFVPLIGVALAVYFFPELVYLFIDPDQVSEMQQMYAPEAQRLGRPDGARDDFVMFAFYIKNNVSIDFQCFAGGLLFGIGTLFFVIFNALHIGAIAGHLTQIGYIETFWGFVAGHSAFELVGIVLSAAAGLEIGYALIAPGQQTRLAALKTRMGPATQLVYGAALLTAMAAVIEGFWSAWRVPPVEVKYGVGIAFWLLVLAYFTWGGRAQAEDS